MASMMDEASYLGRPIHIVYLVYASTMRRDAGKAVLMERARRRGVGMTSMNNCWKGSGGMLVG